MNQPDAGNLGPGSLALRDPGNCLLAALPTEELERLEPDLELVHLGSGQVIYEAGTQPAHAYFPVTAIVALLYVMQDARFSEIAIVGNDGMLGTSLFLGGLPTTNRAVVQSAGAAFRLTASAFTAEVARGGATLRVLLLYAQTLLTQITLTAACNKHHTLKQQCCRWLLLTYDRLQGADLVVPQKLIAKMLGVITSEVTALAQALHDAGAVDYRDGLIELLDRPVLEAASCECYEVGKCESGRLLPTC